MYYKVTSKQHSDKKSKKINGKASKKRIKNKRRSKRNDKVRKKPSKRFCKSKRNCIRKRKTINRKRKTIKYYRRISGGSSQPANSNTQLNPTDFKDIFRGSIVSSNLDETNGKRTLKNTVDEVSKRRRLFNDTFLNTNKRAIYGCVFMVDFIVSKIYSDMINEGPYLGVPGDSWKRELFKERMNQLKSYIQSKENAISNGVVLCLSEFNYRDVGYINRCGSSEDYAGFSVYDELSRNINITDADNSPADSKGIMLLGDRPNKADNIICSAIILSTTFLKHLRDHHGITSLSFESFGTDITDQHFENIKDIFGNEPMCSVTFLDSNKKKIFKIYTIHTKEGQLLNGQLISNWELIDRLKEINQNVPFFLIGDFNEDIIWEKTIRDMEEIVIKKREEHYFPDGALDKPPTDVERVLKAIYSGGSSVSRQEDDGLLEILIKNYENELDDYKLVHKDYIALRNSKHPIYLDIDTQGLIERRIGEGRRRIDEEKHVKFINLCRKYIQSLSPEQFDRVIMLKTSNGFSKFLYYFYDNYQEGIKSMFESNKLTVVFESNKLTVVNRRTLSQTQWDKAFESVNKLIDFSVCCDNSKTFTQSPIRIKIFTDNAGTTEPYNNKIIPTPNHQYDHAIIETTITRRVPIKEEPEREISFELSHLNIAGPNAPKTEYFNGADTPVDIANGKWDFRFTLENTNSVYVKDGRLKIFAEYLDEAVDSHAQGNVIIKKMNEWALTELPKYLKHIEHASISNVAAETIGNLHSQGLHVFKNNLNFTDGIWPDDDPPTLFGVVALLSIEKVVGSYMKNNGTRSSCSINKNEPVPLEELYTAFVNKLF